MMSLGGKLDSECQLVPLGGNSLMGGEHQEQLIPTQQESTSFTPSWALAEASTGKAKVSIFSYVNPSEPRSPNAWPMVPQSLL